MITLAFVLLISFMSELTSLEERCIFWSLYCSLQLRSQDWIYIIALDLKLICSH